MSRKGNRHDNSIMENFYVELEEAIKKYIRYYNEKRTKEKLGWMSPVEYRISSLVA